MTTPKPTRFRARITTTSSFAACLCLAAVAGCSPSQATLDAQFQALQRHQERSEKRQVARSVFQSPRAVAEQCGPDAGVGVGQSLNTECTRRLHEVFFARLEVGYPLANWAEIALLCHAYPEQCGSPPKLEALAAKSQEEASQTRLDFDYARIATEERQRSSRSAPPGPEPTAPSSARALEQTRADHDSKAPYLRELEEQLIRVTLPDSAEDELRGDATTPRGESASRSETPASQGGSAPRGETPTPTKTSRR